jgi:hypothetical protein
MRYKLKDTHPLSFSKDWPETTLFSYAKDWSEHKTPDNPNRTYNPTWIPMDTEENFNRLKKEGFPNRFDANSFNYETNKHGFRCDEFDTIDFTKKSIVYLGCSHTFGIGSPEEDIWCSILHKLLQEHYNTKFNLINLGVQGGTIDDYLRFIPYLKKFNPHMIVSFTPPIHRMIIPYRNRADYCSPVSEKNKKTNAFYQLLKYNDEYFIYKYDMTLQVVKSVADIMNIEFYEANMFENMNFNLDNLELDRNCNIHNRDGNHFSREIHEIVATSYFKMITEK